MLGEISEDKSGVEEEVEKPDPSLKAPDLYQAIKENATNKALELFDEGVPLSHVDENGYWTHLHWAAKHGNAKLVKRIIDNGGSEAYKEYRKSLFTLEVGEEGGEEGENEQLAKNTPLLWAAYTGHLRVVWLLLADGYSPDDTDDMGNNCLHVAAAAGHREVLQVLVNDGGNPFALNIYRNMPINVTTNEGCREILTKYMEQYLTMTPDDRKLLHSQNLHEYAQRVNALAATVSAASKTDTPRALKSLQEIADSIRVLSHALDEASGGGFDDEQIADGKRILLKLERSQELMTCISDLQREAPIRTQEQYIRYVYPLEKSISHAEHAFVERSQVQYARDLTVRSQIEYMLSTALDRVKHVEKATEADEHDMIKLKQFVQKAQALMATEDLVDTAVARLARLESELEITRAIVAVPNVRLPIAEPPADYWGEEDTGHIEETPEYPLPPPETNEYIWEHSIAYKKLAACIERLKNCSNGADKAGANASLIAEAKEKLIKVEKSLKLLDEKDAEDKRIAIENATKLAKKLKKGKKKK